MPARLLKGFASFFLQDEIVIILIISRNKPAVLILKIAFRIVGRFCFFNNSGVNKDFI